MKMPYCSNCTIGEGGGPSHRITSRRRGARAVVGVGWMMLAWALLDVLIPAGGWTLAIKLRGAVSRTSSLPGRPILIVRSLARSPAW